jgi:hypothetical protein
MARILALCIASLLGAARVDAQAALIPAYGNPCCDGGSAMWSQLIANARAGKLGIHVILEPASGPGASPIDPNYVNVGGTGPAVELAAAGGKLYGYVPTHYATRALSEVLLDIDTYYDPAYWRGAGVQVHGIFVDEMSNDIALTGYYEALTEHVKAKDSDAWVFGNPGTSFTLDSSAGAAGFSVDDYAKSVDTIVTFENTGTNYRAAYTAPSWLNRYDARRFAHIVHSEAARSDMLSDINLARSRKAGFIYITDDILPNPYDVLASYWTEEHDTLAAQATPVPALGLQHWLGLALLLLAATKREQRI